jgi:hypothetical protein
MTAPAENLVSSFANVLDNASSSSNLQQIVWDGSISGNKIVKTFSYPRKGLSMDVLMKSPKKTETTMWGKKAQQSPQGLESWRTRPIGT